MEAHGFWLISIDESVAHVSLIRLTDNNFALSSTGTEVNWSVSAEDSLIEAIGKSLSEAATNINLPESEEPDSAAFILPPFWVGTDGKINGEKIKYIEKVCKSLSLKPMGFIANDDALVEEANQKEGFPASFVLVQVGQKDMTLSLVYLGKIKERVRKFFTDQFTPSIIESALMEINSTSTLPPQIIIFGSINQNSVNEVQNYPWIGRKDVETFLHFPEVKYYSRNEVASIFAKAIVAQLNPSAVSHREDSPAQPDSAQTEKIPDSDSEYATQIETGNEEVGASDFGFEHIDLNPLPVENPLVSDTHTGADLPQSDDFNFVKTIESPQDLTQIVNDSTAKHVVENKKFSLKLPKLKLPLGHIAKVPRTGVKLPLLIPLAFSPLLILIPFYFSKADINLFVTPYKFQKNTPIVLDSSATSIEPVKGIIPSLKKSFNISASTSVKTTGKKTVGEKAKGEVILFNKVDKSQSLAKGTVLIGPDNRKFELANTVQVASSSLDLEEGIINMGQTKAMVNALDIGPEYNLPKDTKLLLKDHPETSLVAKAKESFVGGTKREINAVSDNDKKSLEAHMREEIANKVEEKKEKELKNLSGMVKETMIIKNNKIEYSREVGEEADELTASADASVSVLTIDDKTRSQIVEKFLGSEDGYSESEIDTKKFSTSFKINKFDTQTASGTLEISGSALPKIDTLGLKKLLSGKSKSKAGDLVKSYNKRIYDYSIATNFTPISSINPLPFRLSQINIIIKTEN